METDESLTSDSASKSTSTAALKEKKKKLKALFQKRHLNNLSFRNTTLNSTIIKTSLRINNRALAHALERKKSDVRAAEATVLKLQEENQCLTSQVNREKMANEKVKEGIYARLRTVSSTLQLAIEQLVEAMDACASGEFHKLYDALAQTGMYGLMAASEIKRAPSLAQTSTIKCHAVAPARVLASPSKGTDDLSCHDDDLDVDSDDNGQDVAGGLDATTNVRPPNGAGPLSSLSMIVEQSYLVPSDAELFVLEPDPQEQRHQFTIQSSSIDGKVSEESSRNQHVASRTSRSRPRHPAGSEPDSDVGDRADAVVRRSRSRDRRNMMIFQPSSSANSPRRDEVNPDKKRGVTLRRSRSRSTNRNSRSASGNTSESESHCGKSDGGENVPQQNKASVDAASDWVEQLCIYKGLVENEEIMGDQFDSLQFVDETVLSPTSGSPTKVAVEPVAAISSHTNSNVSDFVGSMDRNILSSGATAVSSEFADADAEGTVIQGQFVTRDKIARTPVKARDLTHGGSLGTVDGFRTSVGSVDLSDTLNMGLSESGTNRRLSKREIPTFLPIENSPRMSSSPAKTQGKKPQAQHRDSLKRTVNTRMSSNFAGMLPVEVTRRSRNGKAGCRKSGASESIARADAAGKKAAENVRLSKRGTFSVPGKGAPAVEDDIMKENDSVLINDSLEDLPMAESNFLFSKDQLLSIAKPDSEAASTGHVGDAVLEEASNARDSSEFGMGQRISKRQRVHSAAQKEKSGNSSKASDVCHESVEPVSNKAKRSRISMARSRLPETVKDSKIKDSGSKDATMLDNPGKNLAQGLGDDGELQPMNSERQDQTLDIETKRRFAAYVSKPGNIVFNADRRELGGGTAEVAKKPRSKSRSLLPLRQKARLKTSASAAQPEENARSVWDFQGTPRQAAVKESTERLLSVYDISLNDSSVIPNPKEEPVDQCRSKNKSRAAHEFSKDDSVIVDRRGKTSCHRRHESASGINVKEVKESDSLQGELLDSPHGILLALGNKRKPSTRSKTVHYNIDETDRGKEDICPSNSGLTLDACDVDSVFKVPAARCNGNAKQNIEKNLRKEQLPFEDGKKLASDKDFASVVLSRPAALSAKCDRSKSNEADDLEGKRVLMLTTDHESTGVSTETGINSKEASENLGNEKPKKRSSQSCQSNASPYSCPDQDIRSRRTASHAVSYREPPINKKLRRGDPFTSTIYDGSNHEPPNHFGYEKAAAAKAHRRALSSVENILAGAE